MRMLAARFLTAGEKEAAVIANCFRIIHAREVAVHDRHPVGKAALCGKLAAEVPLAHVSPSIIWIAEELGQTSESVIENGFVMHAAVRVRPCASEKSGTGRRANRLRDICLLKNERL